jgi:hypothetical protein
MHLHRVIEAGSADSPFGVRRRTQHRPAAGPSLPRFAKGPMPVGLAHPWRPVPEAIDLDVRLAGHRRRLAVERSGPDSDAARLHASTPRLLPQAPEPASWSVAAGGPGPRVRH